MSILDLYCSVDPFWQAFEPLWEHELPQAHPLGARLLDPDGV